MALAQQSPAGIAGTAGKTLGHYTCDSDGNDHAAAAAHP